MGNTFTIQNQKQTEVLLSEHLSFVLDNWHLLNIAFAWRKESVKYIITAFFKEDEDDDQIPTSA